MKLLLSPLFNLGVKTDLDIELSFEYDTNMNQYITQ